MLTLALAFWPGRSYSLQKPSDKKRTDTASTVKGQPASPALHLNPFTLERNTIVPGNEFRIDVDKNLFADSNYNIERITLDYKTEQGSKTIALTPSYFKQVEDKLFAFARMPSWDAMKEIDTQSLWSGWLKHYNADIVISYKQGNNEPVKIPFPIKIPSESWGLIWGIVALASSFAFIVALKPEPFQKIQACAADHSKEEWEQTNRLKRFLLYPLKFAITPMGTYSISLTQILIWTYITVFGIVYVYWLTGRFIEISAQMLMLLGIGGGTALGSKMNKVSKVKEPPIKYLKLIERSRTPKLKNLITIKGQPSIYKFQMLAFTVLTAFFVIGEILTTYLFPNIPNSLVTLMGISSVIYLGNEVTLEDEWAKLGEITKSIEKKAADLEVSIGTTDELKGLQTDNRFPEINELIDKLREIYS